MLHNLVAEGYLKTYSYGVPEAMAIIAIMGISAFALWFIRNAITPQDDHAELRQGNVALAIERGGYLLAQAVAMVYAISGSYDPDDVGGSFALIAGKAVYIIVMMVILGFVVDWATLPNVPNNSLLLKGNKAVATAMAGSYLGLGFVVGASTVGTAKSLSQTILASVAFAALGLATVVVVIRLYIFLSSKSYRSAGSNFYKEIEGDDLLPAIDLASLVISTAALVSIGVAGDMTSWWEALKAYTATCTVALGLMLAFQWAAHRAATRGTGAAAARSANQTALVVMIAVARVALAMIVWVAMNHAI